MKKLYSFVLMATMLLIGTNAWAANIRIERTGATEYASLNAAFAAAQNNDVIYLTDNVSESTNAWLGEVSATEGTSRSVTLDLKGYTYTNNRAYADDGDAISITRGKLTVKNGHMVAANARYLFRVYGTYEKIDAKNATPFAHLVIEEDAQLEGRVVVCVDVLRSELAGSAASKCWATYPCDYSCDFFKTMGSGGFGVANGVRVDVYGTIIGHHPTSNGETYGIKVNGCVRYGKEYLNNDGSLKGALYWPTRTVSQQTVHYEPKYANGAENGTYEVTTGDNAYSPYIYVASSASIKTIDKSSTKAAAIYSSGYGRFSIAGEVEGSTGVYVKSGEVEINNATVSSNYAGSYTAAAATNGGVTAAGSGVVMESNKSYTGNMDVTVSGDSQVTGAAGYAIDEAVTNSPGTKVDALTITGGTFESTGSTAQPTPQGTIKVTETTAENQTTTITVSGANVEGTGDNNANIGNKTLEEYLSDSQSGTHITYVDNGQGGTTMVISEVEGTVVPVTEDPDPEESAYSIMNATGNVNWTGTTDQIINANKTLDYLEMNLMQGNPKVAVTQKLTIQAGNTLTVGRVILGSAAEIIVEAGAKFIVTGTQGIVAPAVDNIVLKTTDVAQATFLFNPAVSSNRHPNATVEMATVCKQLTANPWTYTFQRFALPITESVAPTNDYTDQELFGGATTFKSYVFALDYSSNEWEALTSWSQMKAFTSYQLANNTVAGGITYSFKGKLHGNEDQKCNFPVQGFGYFGNSHTAPISISKLLADFGADLEHTVWMYNYAQHKYDVINADAAIFGTLPTEIKSMQAFVLYLRNGSEGEAPINYASSVWGNPNLSAAPARNRANSLNNGALIKVVAENGMEDQVILMEKDSYTNNFENGADASKFMVEDGINLYATTANGNQSIVASDNLENTILSFKAGDAANYTLQLGTVFGEEYAIRDNVTGAIINCAEGMEYAFYQAANTTILGRFEIVGRNNAPTAIENTEAVKTAKGIYTITGQYVGENFDVLPAGVYVVNGVKIVK